MVQSQSKSHGRPSNQAGGCSPCHASRHPFSEGDHMHLQLPKGGCRADRARLFSKASPFLEAEGPKPPPWSPPSTHYFRISPTGCHGAHEGAVHSARGQTPDPTWSQGVGSFSPVVIDVHAAVELGKSDSQDDAGQQEEGAPAQAEPEGILGAGGELSGPRQRLGEPLLLPGPPQRPPTHPFSQPGLCS